MSTVLVSGAVRFLFDIYERLSADLGVAAQPHKLDYQRSVESGTGTNQADLVWSDKRSVTAGVPDDIDLRGVIASALNSGISFVKITGIVIRNKSTTSGQYLTVGNDGVAPFFAGLFGASTHTVQVNPDGAFGWYSPIDPATTTAVTADILQVVAATGTIEYEIEILGRTA